MLEEIRKIKEGKSFTDFDRPTSLMVIAAINYQHITIDKIPEDLRSLRVIKLLLSKDYHVIDQVTDDQRQHLSASFALWGNHITRDNLQDFIEVFNAEPVPFIKNVIRHAAGMKRFLTPAILKNVKIAASIQGNSDKPQTTIDKGDGFEEDATYDFLSAGLASINEVNPETFLSLPLAQKTEPLLNKIIESDIDFPPDFIERLQLPNKNAAFYKSKGLDDKASFWSAQKIPFFNRAMCDAIVARHPEGSINTPGYLTAQAVVDFWDRKQLVGTAKDTMSTYFLSFPAEFETVEMAADLAMSWKILAHAPALFVNSEPARLYLNRYPNDILRLPEEYQIERRLIADGVKIETNTLKYIKNEDMRASIALAFGIGD